MPADLPDRHGRRRAVVAALGLLALVGVAQSDGLHGALVAAVAAVEPVVAERPLAGAALFVGLSAVSALMAFVSSAALVPVALATWGPWGTAALLWLGWMVGGLGAYGVGRGLGRPVLEHLDRGGAAARWLARIGPETPVAAVALIQFALQSELAGLVLGTARYPLSRYLAALALVEVVFARLIVAAGSGLMDRQVGPLIAAGAALVAVGALALAVLRRRLPPD